MPLSMQVVCVHYVCVCVHVDSSVARSALEHAVCCAHVNSSVVSSTLEHANESSWDVPCKSEL